MIKAKKFFMYNQVPKKMREKCINGIYTPVLCPCGATIYIKTKKLELGLNEIECPNCGNVARFIHLKEVSYETIQNIRP